MQSSLISFSMPVYPGAPKLQVATSHHDFAEALV
jgi:hypothetical protein